MLPQVSHFFQKIPDGMSLLGLEITMIQQKDGFSTNTLAGFTRKEL